MSGGRVVVGVDGSPAAHEALAWALAQAALTGAEVHAVLAWHPPIAYGPGGAAIVAVDWEANARQVLRQAVAELPGPPDGPVVPHLVQGHPAQVLVTQAAGAELLVVGSRGHGGFAGLLLGSVSEHVVAHAPCPVVVVRKTEHAAAQA